MGMAVNAIASKLETNWVVARAALDFANGGGKVPMLLPRELPRNGKPMAAEKRAEIVRLRDEEHLSFVKIGARLGIDNTTASRVYDRAKARMEPRPHKRVPYHTLPKGVFDTIESMLAGGHRVADIAKAARCSQNTVRRYRDKKPK